MPKRKKNLAEMVSKMGGTDLNKNDLQALLLQLISEVRVMDKEVVQLTRILNCVIGPVDVGRV